MCEWCHFTVCPPGCPSYEGREVGRCALCGDPIYEGEDVIEGEEAGKYCHMSCFFEGDREEALGFLGATPTVAAVSEEV